MFQHFLEDRSILPPSVSVLPPHHPGGGSCGGLSLHLITTVSPTVGRGGSG